MILFRKLLGRWVHIVHWTTIHWHWLAVYHHRWCKYGLGVHSWLHMNVLRRSHHTSIEVRCWPIPTRDLNWRLNHSKSNFLRSRSKIFSASLDNTIVLSLLLMNHDMWGLSILPRSSFIARASSSATKYDTNDGSNTDYNREDNSENNDSPSNTSCSWWCIIVVVIVGIIVIVVARAIIVVVVVVVTIIVVIQQSLWSSNWTRAAIEI